MALEKSRDHLGAAKINPKLRWDFTEWSSEDFAKCWHYGTGHRRSEAGSLTGDFARSHPAGEIACSAGLHARRRRNEPASRRSTMACSPRSSVSRRDGLDQREGVGRRRLAVQRLIVDGYPLGTNSDLPPRATLDSDEPAWLKLDTKYRKGSWAYLEFATYGGSNATGQRMQRIASSFGVSEIVCPRR